MRSSVWLESSVTTRSSGSTRAAVGRSSTTGRRTGRRGTGGRIERAGQTRKQPGLQRAGERDERSAHAAATAQWLWNLNAIIWPNGGWGACTGLQRCPPRAQNHGVTHAVWGLSPVQVARTCGPSSHRACCATIADGATRCPARWTRGGVWRARRVARHRCRAPRRSLRPMPVRAQTLANGLRLGSGDGRSRGEGREGHVHVCLPSGFRAPLRLSRCCCWSRLRQPAHLRWRTLTPRHLADRGPRSPACERD